MKFCRCSLFCVFGLVVLWRVALLVFTTQPVPENDAFFFDGAVVNWILHGHYFNPSLAEVFPISGHQVYSAYPPFYQGVLALWMLVFGTSVISAMALHLVLFAVSGLLVLAIVEKYFPDGTSYALAGLLFFAITFNDRPEDLAHIFGLLALLLLARKISGDDRRSLAIGLTLVLLAALYTSVIVGAFYFGAAFLAAALAWLVKRKKSLFVPFFAAAALFAVITFSIAKTEPLWWRGFLENARQTPVLAVGFRVPQVVEIIKLVRNVPLFLVALFFLPAVLARRKTLFSGEHPWLFLVAGIFAMGWVLLLAGLTLFTANYVMYALYTQVILAAGLLVLVGKLFPEKVILLRAVMLGCALLVSVRAIGMTTWGAACAWKNSYTQTHATLRAELQPFAQSDAPVIISSAFLYSALEFGVRHPLHSDWYFDRATATAHSSFDALVQLHPPKLVLAQSDYYRAFQDVLAELRQHPELVEIRVRDEAAVRPPDAIPSLQRGVQHISWAPVIVDLDWK